MLGTLRLLLPALMPAWNFFDVIADSPRVEFARVAGDGEGWEAGAVWREFRPRPERVSPGEMLRRMAWNARWNEALFVVSCAERLLDRPTAHSEDEIFRRIAADIADGEAAGDAGDDAWLAFRIVLVSEDADGGLARETAFTASPRRLDGIGTR